MQRILLALVIGYVIVIAATAVLGFRAQDSRSFAAHFGMGLFATLYTCLIYCILLTYFVITGKLVKQAVLNGHLDEILIRQSQRPKGIIVSLTAVAVAITLIAALLGAWANIGGEQDAVRSTYHMIAEMLSVAANLAAFGMCYHLVHRNGPFLEKVLSQVRRDQSPTTPYP
ncbi:MAG: hypothetical protein IIA66_02195 [Planctomycetes bacterium]|nr:hypothetical protein [Planctomycetota bacterium]